MWFRFINTYEMESFERKDMGDLNNNQFQNHNHPKHKKEECLICSLKWGFPEGKDPLKQCDILFNLQKFDRSFPFNILRWTELTPIRVLCIDIIWYPNSFKAVGIFPMYFILNSKLPGYISGEGDRFLGFPMGGRKKGSNNLDRFDPSDDGEDWKK